ncbi:UNVERIFIED_CONTAM: hypothetical protein Sindi_0096800 [Sesamum indicum]
MNIVGVPLSRQSQHIAQCVFRFESEKGHLKSKNEKRCWYNIGSPPPAGSKKVVLKFRSVNNMVIAPASTGSDNKSGNAVTRTDQTNRGDLCIVIPGPRMLEIVNNPISKNPPAGEVGDGGEPPEDDGSTVNEEGDPRATTLAGFIGRKPDLAMEDEESGLIFPAADGNSSQSHGSPRSGGVEGPLLTRKNEFWPENNRVLDLVFTPPKMAEINRLRLLVDHGDAQAMDALKELKRRWEARFGIAKSRLPAEKLKVDDHPFARELRQACRRLTAPGTTKTGAGGSGLAVHRRTAVRGKKIATSPPADSHRNDENGIPAATVGLPTKSDVRRVADVDDYVGKVEADVATHLVDMEAELESEKAHEVSHDVSPNEVNHDVSPNDVSHDVSPDDVSHDVSPDDVSHDVSPNDAIHDVSPNDVNQQKFSH